MVLSGEVCLSVSTVVSLLLGTPPPVVTGISTGVTGFGTLSDETSGGTVAAGVSASNQKFYSHCL